MLLKNKPIQNTDKIISVSGKVFYNDRRRRIDVKKPIRDLFEDDSLEVGYTMELCFNETKAVERLKELSEKKILPVLLYFTTEGEDA
jgi:hypothetical protein